MVVLGSSSRIADEVHEETCRQRRIEVLRRSSGGAAVIAGPGCLMYALVLDRRSHSELRGIDTTHRFVLDRLVAALEPLVPSVVCRGTSDLALAERKFSGNSLRVRRNWLLYHGTLLYSFPLRLIDACLGMPARQPEYRAGRKHIGFVRNLPLTAAAIRRRAGRSLCRRKFADTMARGIDAAIGRGQVQQSRLDPPTMKSELMLPE